MTDPPFRIALASISLDFEALVTGRNLAIHALQLWLRRDPALAARCEVRLWDAGSRQPQAQLLEELIAYQPELLGLSCYCWNTPRLVEVARLVQERCPGTMIVLGGPDAGSRAELLLGRHPWLDGIARGEGEETLRLLVRRIIGLDSADWQTTPGLAVRLADQFVQNPEPPLVAMDDLPSLLDLPDAAATLGGMFSLESARGCRFACSYCQYNESPRRQRSLARVVAELERFSALGGGLVMLLDAGVTQEPGRFGAILEAMDRCGNLVLGGAEVNIEQLDDTGLEQFAALNTEVAAIGLQTTHPATLRNIRRAYHPERFAQRVGRLRELGVAYTFDVIYGLPGDDYTTFAQSLADAFALQPQRVACFRLQVLPGSRLAREVERWGLRFDPEPPYLLQSCASFSAEEMVRAERLARINDVVHFFTLDSQPFQAVCAHFGINPVVGLEELLAGEWRGLPVAPAELDDWLSRAHFQEALEACATWIEWSVTARGRSPLPPGLRDQLAEQTARGRLGVRAHVPAEGEAPSLEPTSRLVRSPNLELVRLQEPLPDEEGGPEPYTHVLLVQQPGGIVEANLPWLVGRSLELADAALTLAELEERLRDEDPALVAAELHAQLPAALGQLRELDALRVVGPVASVPQHQDEGP